MERSKFIIIFLIILSISSVISSSSNGVFRVHHKFYGTERSLTALSAHDNHRRGRFLSAIDIPLGGNGNPNNAGLYYAKIKLGSPPQDYHVQVDTGSDLLWVNCIQCTTCHKESGIGIKLRLYDPKESVTAKELPCDTDFCDAVHHGQNECTSNGLCLYQVRYADGSQTDGYFVKDTLVYDRVTGNDVPSPGNASVVFGCGAKQSGDLGTTNEAVDGIIGFGQSNSSVLSQLASAGKVKKVFSHCLDGQNGGGIFAIGQVVKPKVKSTPLVQDTLHYNVNLEEISVGKTVLDLPSDLFETGEKKGTIIDSGTTLAYLPEIAYKALLSEILSNHADLQILVVESQYQCFQYSGSVDDGFPTVTFHFEDSVSLTVYPHEYLFSTEVDGKELWCFGWQNAGLQQEAKDLALLGDIVLSNKLFVYDLENQVIGWTEYNCSSSIELLDDHSKSTSVDAHDLSSAYILNTPKILLLGLLSIVFYF